MMTFLWSTTQRKALTSAGTALAMIFGLVTAGPAAYESWDSIGAPTLATRGWVRPHLAQLKEVRTEIAVGKRENAERERDRLELEYLRAATDEERIKNKQFQRKQEETIKKLDDAISAIGQGK